MEPVSLARLMEVILEQTGPALRARGMKVDVRVDRVMLWSGGQRLSRVLALIIAKALKASGGKTETSMDIRSKTTEELVAVDFELGGLGLGKEDMREINEQCGPPPEVYRGDATTDAPPELSRCGLSFDEGLDGRVTRIIVSMPL